MMSRGFILAAIAGVLLLQSSSVSAKSTSLTQRIVPLNCVLQTIDNGTGIRYQVAPENCGVVVGPPAKIPSSPPAPALSTPPSFRPESTVVTSTPRVIDLTNLFTLNPDGAAKPPIKITATLGQVYQFAVTVPKAQDKPQEDNRSHSLIISDIDYSNPANKTVTVTIHSKVFVRTIAEGQTIFEDLDSNGQPNIGITAESITANGVKLTMWQLAPKAVAKVPASPVHAGIVLVEEQPQLFRYVTRVAVLIIACIVTIVLITRKYRRRGR
jgi:hypothetical protein